VSESYIPWWLNIETIEGVRARDYTIKADLFDG